MAWDGEQVANHLDWDVLCEMGNRIDRRASAVPSFEIDDQSVDKVLDDAVHACDGARRQGACDGAADPCVKRRVVEHQRGRMMLVEKRVAEFRPELDLLVGGENGAVLVDTEQVGMARQEQPAGRKFMDRCPDPQRRIMRMRIVDEAGRKVREVEIHGSGRG